MLNKADSESDVMLETHYVRKYEEFSCIDKSLQCYMKFKNVRKQLLNKLQ
jgi:hypothetical protein